MCAASSTSTATAAKRHRLDVYRNADAGPGAPVLLQIHGGGWVIGNNEQQGLPLMYHLATRGWVCVAINYRLSPKATWPDHLLDCKRALAWIRAHIAEYGGDPDYVVVTGGSAGGHLTALMGLTPNDPQFQPEFESVDTHVRAMVPFYGVYDWTNRFGQRGKHDGLRRVLERFVVKRRYADAPEVFDQASPMSHVNADAPPALIVHGDLDTLAPVTEARRFVQMLRETSRSAVVYAELRGAAPRVRRVPVDPHAADRRGGRPVPHVAAHRRPSRSVCRARCARRRIGERCVSGGTTERSDVHGP